MKSVRRVAFDTAPAFFGTDPEQRHTSPIGTYVPREPSFGHRAFRPSVLAKELGIYDAVNVGAAGTLVIRKPGLRAKFPAELRRKRIP